MGIEKKKGTVKKSEDDILKELEEKVETEFYANPGAHIEKAHEVHVRRRFILFLMKCIEMVDAKRGMEIPRHIPYHYSEAQCKIHLGISKKSTTYKDWLIVLCLELHESLYGTAIHNYLAAKENYAPFPFPPERFNPKWKFPKTIEKMLKQDIKISQNED